MEGKGAERVGDSAVQKRPRGALIASVHPGSIAEEVGLAPGDRIVKANGQLLRDLIDLHRLSAGSRLTLEVKKANGEQWEVEIEKEEEEGLGLTVASAVFDGVRRCANRCLFCFIDQLPPGLRPSLYLKDDDYRLSFCCGNFITLTNLTEEDFRRIQALRLSPLYISVHAVQPELRAALLKNPRAGEILPQLRRLAEAGIQMHLQLVLCPGWNDGPALEETLFALGALAPAVLSIGAVPVGLTRFRQGAAPLRPFTPAEAKAVLETIRSWQSRFLAELGTRLVFAADEFYFLAEEEIPPAIEYEDFPQVENGIGLTRLLWEELEEAVFPAVLPSPRTLLLVTGLLGAQALKPAISRLQQVERLKVMLCPVRNRFFGPEITVTGLLTGEDICTQVPDALAKLEAASATPAEVVVPSIIFKEGEGETLDGFSPAALEQRLARPLRVVPATAAGLAQLLREEKGHG
ncbi:MAG: DUF512 domain-containing protein [Bacillota bacterium]|nr:DUF512 domain-containing protein [Bacillota bacterium]